MANKGAQYSAALQVTANIQGDISKTMESGVKQAQAGVRRGVRSGANAAAQESSKGKRRFGNMMFEASRAAEDFGQQLSVSFDQAVRASANNITQMVAVSGNQYAAMATSVAVALYFMLDPIKELVGSTRQWGDHLEVVEGRIRGIKDALAKGVELREFEQALVAGLTPEGKKPDQWQTQEANLEERQKDLKARRTALQAEQDTMIKAEKSFRELGLLGSLGEATPERRDATNKLLRKTIGFSDEEFDKLKTAMDDYQFLMKAYNRRVVQPLGQADVPVTLNDAKTRRYDQIKHQADLFLKNELSKLGLPEDTDLAVLGTVIDQMDAQDPIMTRQRKLGQEINKIKEEELTIEEKLNITKKHSEAIAKKRLQLDRDRLDTMRSMSNLAQEGSKAEMDVLRRIDLSGYGGGPTSSVPAGPTPPGMMLPVPDEFGQFSGLRRTADGRLVSGGMRGGGGDAFGVRAHWIASGIGGAGFGKSKRRRKTAEEWAALGIGPREPRTARAWRELGVRHASVGQAPNQPGRWIMHRQPGSEFLDPEIVKASPWERMPPLMWGARGGRGTAESPLRNIWTGYRPGPGWENRRPTGPLRKTGLTEREKRRFRASRGGGTASDIINRPPMRIIEQAFGAGAASVSKWMDSTEFWQGGDRGAAFVPGYPGSRSGSIGTHPSSPGMTPSQSRLLESFWIGSGYQRSRYGADADLDVQRGADSQLDAEHPVMSPGDQLKADRNFEVEEQSSQYLKSIADDTREMARQRKPKIVHIPGGP